VITLWPPPGAWPANILRFHLAFARPMDAWRAMDHVALETAAPGLALLDLPDGLWDAAQRVLTVLLHPGRVKRGVGALGPALRAGEVAVLRLGPGLADAQGMPLGRERRFTLTVTPAIRTGFHLPSTLAPPGARGAIPLDLGRPLDLLGAAEGLRLTDAAGRMVAHCAEPSPRGALLHPAIAWPAGPLHLAAAPWLEDVCGNRQDAPFELARTG